MSVSSAVLRTHVHATEDREKVLAALRNTLPPSLRETVEVESESYEGHYGNRIEVLTVELRDSEEAGALLSYLLESLGDADRRLLLATLAERVDESGSLYLRLDKQSAYRGVLELSDGDDVIKIEIRVEGGRRGALRILKEVLSR
ncbi:MAG: RNA-binding domain-containing protein [Acidilobaceae archaeon]